MAHLATRRFSYWGQLGILIAFTCMGFIIGQFASIIPFLGKINLGDLKGASSSQIMDNFFKPENISALRWMQFISTLCTFFLPPVLYALVCHQKPFAHLGFNRNFNLLSGGVIIFIMLAALPMVSLLQDLTEMLPWSKNTLLKFKAAEEGYNKMVAVMARMNNFSDYLISLIVIAFLPAMFEETLFRGGLQNLLSRWSKMPVLSITITAIVFSAVHLSYLGFLSRFALGFILGWFYYRTGNIWLNILGHFFNNAFAVTYMYVASRMGQKIDPSNIEDHFPLWVGFASIAIVFALFKLFEKVSKKQIFEPGAELLIPGVPFKDNSLSGDIAKVE